MRTALAADEPEPERQRLFRRVADDLTTLAAGSGVATSGVIYTFPSTATVPLGVQAAFRRGAGMVAAPPVDDEPQPWQCPECKVWNAPHVCEHRCA